MARKRRRPERSDRPIPALAGAKTLSGAGSAMARPGDAIAFRCEGVGPGSRQWSLVIVAVSVVGAVLGGIAIALSLLSVSAATSFPVVQAQPPAQTMRPLDTPAAPTRSALAAPPTPSSGASPQAASRLDQRSKGRPDAPVAIEEWFDFQCGGCARFALSIEPEVRRLYVDTGMARLVARNFPFLGPESFLAAEAAEAAAALGRYWEYKTLLFTRFQREGRAAYRPERLKAYAAELGLDQRVFGEALDRGAFRASVLAERREGEALGVGATPSFVMNGRLLDGIPTVERFGKLIEEELARKR